MVKMDTLCRVLAQRIKDEITENFDKVHLSGNLADTMYIERVGDNEYKLHIPAQVYDQYQYVKNNVIVYQPEKGSYAESVDEYGGYVFGKPTWNHIGYVEGSIVNGIKWWKHRHRLKTEVEWK